MARVANRFPQHTRSPFLSRSRRRRLLFESLEERFVLATFVVNSTADTQDSGEVASVCDTALSPSADPPVPASGICTFNAAIFSANVNPGFDTIQFAIPGAGVPTINVSALFTIIGPLMIDGSSQSAGTVELRGITINLAKATTFSSSGSTIRGITFNESGIGVQSDNNVIVGNRFGLTASGDASPAFAGTAIAVSGSNNIVGGAAADRNVIGNYGLGIYVVQFQQGSTFNNIIRGNYVGTNQSGNVAQPMSESGISVIFAPDTLIEDNVVAASKFGISVNGNTATGTILAGNFIGTNADGTITDPDGQAGNTDDFGNGKGIFVNDAPGVLITNNVVAGSTARGTDFGYGIQFANPNAAGAILRGNKIGVNAAGTAPLGNKSDGIFIERASNITIGGTSEADRNIISGNGGDGVTVFGTTANPASNHQILGNYIGVDADGEQEIGNRFRGVHIDSVSKNNVIGGDSPNARNIISGNESDGVIIALAGAENNVVKGNYIGTDKDGVSALPNGGSGIRIFDAPRNLIGQSSGSSMIGNLISANTLHGVLIHGTAAQDNVVTGNLIGTDVSGTTELPNVEHGIYILNSSSNRIGDVFNGGPSAPGFPGNVIAAKGAGVRIEGVLASQNEVLRNLIGVDITGANPWSTIATAGIQVIDAPNNRIGVPKVGTGDGGNTISHNQFGIHLLSLLANSGTGTIGTIIGGNFIGTDSVGAVSEPPSKLGNVLEGIEIESFANNYIGGQPTGSAVLPPNIIAGNGTSGVGVIGARAIGNTIQGNSIHSNVGLGVDLAGNGITGQDPLDEDPGPNDLQNAPFVVPAVRSDGSYELVGTLQSSPNNAYRVEFFLNEEPDPSGFGEGQTMIGFVDGVKTDNAGNALFSFAPPNRPQQGFITATVTNSTGSTSEFSCATPVQGIQTDGHIFGVTTTEDNRPGSLRYAIDIANLHTNIDGNLDRIAFCLTGTGPHTIRPTSQLPTIVDPVFIDGRTFTSATANTNSLDNGSNASLFIELDGTQAGPGANGLHIISGNSLIQGLAINRFQGAGILIEDMGFNAIEGNFIGTNVKGTAPLPNTTAGILIKDSTFNTVGGYEAESGNLISGNTGSGIAIVGATALSNLVAGNWIGTDATGNAALPNSVGVRIVDASLNEIGGIGNIISGNTGDGVEIVETEAAGTTEWNSVLANRIGSNATGTAQLSNAIGVRIHGAANNFVGNIRVGESSITGNLLSGNLQYGILIAGDGAVNNVVQKNLVGTDINGSQAVPNLLGGITISDGADNNRIGGSSADQRNIISGNLTQGVLISDLGGAAPQGNRVLGNYIGTTKAGSQRLGNDGPGVSISGASKNEIGGALVGEGNLISANKNGIVIAGQAAIENVIDGNKIGTDLNGDIAADPANRPLRNTEHGVLISNANKNRIGQVLDPSNLCDPTSAPANIIAGNSKNGIRIDGDMASENLISCNSIHDNGHVLQVKGHGVVVAAGTKNTIRFNSIHDHVGRGIDLGNDGVTLNGFGEDNAGANHLQDYPVVTRVSFGLIFNTITWTLNSTANTEFQLDFFFNTEPDPSGFGEGRSPFHTAELITGNDGNGSVTFSFLRGNQFMSATATDPDGNTSEFSMVDTDGDALADAWETQGVDANGDGKTRPWENGTVDLNEDGVNDHLTAVFLPAANPFHKDVFVEVDTMVGREMLPNAIALLTNGTAGVGGFSNAPHELVQNPDGNDGITMHAIVDETDIPLENFPNRWTEFDPIKDVRFGQPQERVHANAAAILATKRLAYRYCLFANTHSNGNSSGFGELPPLDSPFGTNDFTVTLGSIGGGNEQFQASTFMHEMGHTFGLRHGGDQDDAASAARFNYKPNYHSVMNYLWQFGFNNARLAASWVLDYSTETFQTLDEMNLSESNGLTVSPDHAAHDTIVGAGKAALHGRKLISESGNIDWSGILDAAAQPIQAGYQPHDHDMDGTDDNDLGIRFDANGNGIIDTGVDSLKGFEDWPNLRYYFLESADGSADGVHQDTVDEIDFEEIDRLSRLGVDNTEIELLALTSTDDSGSLEIEVTYDISINAAPPFEIAFASSPTPFLNASASQLGNRLQITEPMDRTLGTHTLRVMHSELAQALLDVGHAYIFAIANPDASFAEIDSSNNEQYFVGIFQQATSTSPLVVRGRDPGGITNTDGNDSVSIEELGQELVVTFNGLTHRASTSRVSDAAVVTLGGNDQIQLGAISIPLFVRGGEGQDELRLTSSGQQYDLGDLTDLNVESFEVIDLVGSGSNGLTLKPDDVFRIVGSGSPLLLRHNEDDEVRLDPAWSIHEPIFQDLQTHHVLRSTNEELLVANTRPWQNPLRSLDANRNDFVSPLDALVLINSINQEGSRALPDPTSIDTLPIFYFDTNGDTFLSPIDVLLVINFINGSGISVGESEGGYESAIDKSQGVSDSVAFPVAFPMPATNLERPFQTRFVEREDVKQSVDRFFADFGAGSVRKTTRLARQSRHGWARSLLAPASGQGSGGQAGDESDAQRDCQTQFEFLALLLDVKK